MMTAIAFCWFTLTAITLIASPPTITWSEAGGVVAFWSLFWGVIALVMM